jgi:hypothetical protein
MRKEISENTKLPMKTILLLRTAEHIGTANRVINDPASSPESIHFYMGVKSEAEFFQKAILELST